MGDNKEYKISIPLYSNEELQGFENKLLDKKRELQIECSNCSFKKSFCDELKEINGCTNGKLIKIIDELLEEING